MAVAVFILYSLGAAIRYCLIRSPLSSVIASRVEVSTPLNSWIRVKEGVFLHSQNISVYSGGVYHGSPIELYVFSYIIKEMEKFIPLLFIALDLSTAYILSRVAARYCSRMIKQENVDKKNYFHDNSIPLLKDNELSLRPYYVSAAYLFSPYAIVSCIAHTTTVYANLLLALMMLTMVEGKSIQFGCLNALCSYQSFYPVSFLVPGILTDGKINWTSVRKVSFSFISMQVILIIISAKLSNGWDFIEATYGFILSSPDLTPNIGLFWYFFTEMFEHFRLFFLATFQINAFIYVIPLATKLRKDPMLLTLALLALSAVFRSYPSLGDVALYLSLLPLWQHLYSYLRQTFLVGCMLIASSVLGPIMYNLWMFSGSANANFYFAVTLSFNTAQIFLVTDLLFAHVKRQYHLYNGSKLEIDGEPVTLTLK